MMIAKTCDGEKGKDIKTFVTKVRTPVMMLIYHRRLVRIKQTCVTRMHVVI